jgi:hypothetical protein
MTLETQIAFAKRRGVSRKSVREWKDRGWVVMASGKVDVERSEALLATRPECYMGGTTSQPGNANTTAGIENTAAADVSSLSNRAPQPLPAHLASADWSLAEASRRREIATAMKRQLDYETAAGRLISSSDVAVIMKRDYQTTVARMLQLPSKVASQLAATMTAPECEQLMRRAFVLELNRLSKIAGDQLRKLEARGT